MSEATSERIARLLEAGLEHYGEGDVAKAILVWEEVLVLDPKNEDARDYIRTADRRKRPRELKDPESSPAVRAIVTEARGLARAGSLGESLDLLRSAVEAIPRSLELQSGVDLLRARLLTHYRDEFAEGSALVRVKEGAGDLRRFNLPADAGFLLAQVDGSTSVSDLVTLSGMDDFEALHTLHGLRSAGIVEIAS